MYNANMKTLKGKRVMVTGGAGFIGSHLIDRLIKEDLVSLYSIDNYFLGNNRNLQSGQRQFPKLRILKEDVTNIDNIRRILIDEKIDVVFNLAVLPLLASLEKPVFTVNSIINSSITFCELLREKLFKTLIHFSSSEVYGTAQYVPMDERHPLEPCTPYAAAKAAADHIVNSYIKTFNINATIVRPFNNYGPRQNKKQYAALIPIVVNNILSHKPVIIYGDGKQTRDFIFVRDVVDATIEVYNNPETRGKVINIASGKELSIFDIVHTIIRVMNSDTKIIYKPERPGDVRRHFADISLAKKLINFQPSTDMEKGLIETVEWYKNNL